MADDTNKPLFGANPAVSPESLKQKREMLAQLLKQGLDTSPIRSPWQGAARLAETLVGALAQSKYDTAEKEAREAGESKRFELAQKAGLNPYMAALLSGSGNDPWNNPEIARKLADLAVPQREETPTAIMRVAPTSGRPLPGSGIEKPLTGTAESPPVAIPPSRFGVGTPGAPIPQPRPGGAPSTGGGAPQSMLPPEVGQMREENAATTRKLTTQNLVRAANTNAWTEDMGRYQKAPGDIQNLRLLRDTVASYEPTRGDAGNIVNRAKQTLNGIIGRDVMGETAPAEFIKNVGNVMSMEIANKGRGTNLDLETAQGALPTGLQGSKQGALNMIDHVIQMRMQDRKLGQTFVNAMETDPDHYISNRNEWLGKKENVLTSPLTGRSTADQPTGPNLKGAPNAGWKIERLPSQ